MNDESPVWDVDKLSHHSLRKYECFFEVKVDYSDPNAFEILKEKVNNHFMKDLRVNHQMAIEKLLKMKKDDRLDDGVKRYSRVPRNSDEWNKIEYSLQVSLASVAPCIKGIWSIANPNMTLQFVKMNKDSPVIESFLPTLNLDSLNKAEKVAQRGFDFPSQGLLFPTGHISMDFGQYPKQNKIFEVMLVRIAPGKAYSVAQNRVDQINNKNKIPSDFDSVFVLRDNKQDDSTYFKNDYLLFESHQALPAYIIQFEFNQRREVIQEKVQCDLCGDNIALIHCQTENTDLCQECDYDHHSRMGRLQQRHKRLPISEKPKYFKQCEYHPQATYEFYDPIDHQPLCVYCKIDGSHSTGEKSKHKILKINDAYQKALLESRDLDPHLEKRRNHLGDLLSTVDKKIKEINMNANEVEEQIYKLLENALQTLHTEVQKKLNTLFSNQLEIKRQFEEINWYQGFLKYQQEILSPSDYLSAFSNHNLAKSDILRKKLSYSELDIEADLKVMGTIEVVPTKYFPDNKASYTSPEEKRGAAISSTEYQNSNLLSPEKAQMNSAARIKQLILEKGGNSGGIVRNLALSENGNDKIPDLERNKMMKSYQTESPHNGIRYNSNSSAQKQQVEYNPHIKHHDYQSPEHQIADTINMLKDQNESAKKSSLARPPSHRAQPKSRQRSQDESPGFLMQPVADQRFEELKQDLDPSHQAGDFFKDIFPGTKILNSQTAKLLYLNIPFTLGQPPLPSLIFQRGNIESNNINIVSLFEKSENQYPNLILCKYQDQVFGGYASHPWNNKNSKNFGDHSCFLFNLSKGLKLMPRNNINSIYLWQGPSGLSFGNADLIIDAYLNEFVSQVDNQYSSGKNLTQNEAKSFLMGHADRIIPEIVEIYILTPPPSDDEEEEGINDSQGEQYSNQYYNNQE